MNFTEKELSFIANVIADNAEQFTNHDGTLKNPKDKELYEFAWALFSKVNKKYYEVLNG